jgi:hypothetical protein
MAAIPQAIVKIYNNSLVGKDDITAAYWLSVVVSLLYIVIGLYRYVYLLLVEKTSFSKLSFMSNYSLQIGGDYELVGIPHRTYDVRRNKEVCELDINKYKKLLQQCEVEEVLMLAENLITRCFLSEQEFIRVSSIVGGDGRATEKSMNKLHVELSNIMRQCKLRQISAHDIASRVFTLIIRDTIDNSVYSYFKFHGINSAQDLINCSPSVVDNIVNSINRHSTKRVVTAYLRLIALNKADGIRESVATVVEGIIFGARLDRAELYRYSSYSDGMISN